MYNIGIPGKNLDIQLLERITIIKDTGIPYQLFCDSLEKDKNNKICIIHCNQLDKHIIQDKIVNGGFDIIILKEAGKLLRNHASITSLIENSNLYFIIITNIECGELHLRLENYAYFDLCRQKLVLRYYGIHT